MKIKLLTFLYIKVVLRNAWFDLCPLSRSPPNLTGTRGTVFVKGGVTPPTARSLFSLIKVVNLVVRPMLSLEMGDCGHFLKIVKNNA